MTNPEFEVRKVKMHDTGLGREAGFRNDAELIEHALAQRARLPRRVRSLLDKFDRELEDRILFGVSFEDSDGKRIDPRDVEPG